MSSELPKLSSKNMKQLVHNNFVQFQRYFDAQLWYSLHMSQDDYHNGGAQLMEFPVPIEEIGDATFYAHDKAILFMRYIRKHLEMIEKAKEAAV